MMLIALDCCTVVSLESVDTVEHSTIAACPVILIVSRMVPFTMYMSLYNSTFSSVCTTFRTAKYLV